MIYRKASPSPPRMLLRIVAGAGACAIAAACSSTSPDVEGSVATMDAGRGDAAQDAGDDAPLHGVIDSGGVGDVVTGVVVNPDAASGSGGGIMVNPDASGDVVTGVVVNPDASAD